MKSIRETFLPDINPQTGKPEVFVRCDLAQVEHRMGLMYCGTERMLPYASISPDVYDAFTEYAKEIFGKEEVTKQMRYLTKKITHASWRDMKGDKMSESISKDTEGKLFVPARQCQRLLDIYLGKNPEITEIYMPWVRQQVRETGILTTSWGRRLDVRNRRIDQDLYRIAYSYYLQAEAADWTNQYGFLPGSTYMQQMHGKPLSAQVHDEVIASVPLEAAFDYSFFIVHSLQQSKEIPAGSGNFLTVPAGIVVGHSWGDPDSVEFKVLPGREEFYSILSDGGFA